MPYYFNSAVLFFLSAAWGMIWLCDDEEQSRRQKKKEKTNTTNVSITTKTTNKSNKSKNKDSLYLQRAHELRLALSKPVLSRFRVVALLLVQPNNNNDDNDNDDGSHPVVTIFGTNEESSPCISGAICAERAALLQYRCQQVMMVMEHLPSGSRQHSPLPPQPSRIRDIYIVSDCPSSPIPPGLLCREYMIGHTAIDSSSTRIILQSADVESEPWITTLTELYPYPCLYSGLSVQEQLHAGQSYQTAMNAQHPWNSLEWWREILMTTTTTSSNLWNATLSIELQIQLLQPLLQRAHQVATQHDYRTDIFPVQYGAAGLLFDPSTLTGSDAIHSNNSNNNNSINNNNLQYTLLAAAERKTLEYGATQDAVSQLFAQAVVVVAAAASPAVADTMSSSSPEVDDNVPRHQLSHMLLVHVDQFGVFHPPFAPARSLLVEHGWGDRTTVLIVRQRTPDHVSNDLSSSSATASWQLHAVQAADLAPFAPQIFQS